MQYNINVVFGEPSNRTSLELKPAILKQNRKKTAHLIASNRTSLELKLYTSDGEHMTGNIIHLLIEPVWN